MGGALTELDLKLAQAKHGDVAPAADSATYRHFSSLLQKIQHKKLDVKTQRSYTSLIDEILTQQHWYSQPQQCNNWQKSQLLPTNYLIKWYNNTSS